MFGFTYNLTDTNTITISRATGNTSEEWTFKNLREAIKDFEKQGYKVEIKL